MCAATGRRPGATRAAGRLKSGVFWALLWRKVNSGLSARNRNGRLSLNR
jgi:hypothetical protein